MNINKNTMDEFNELANANLELQGRDTTMDDELTKWNNYSPEEMKENYIAQLEGLKEVRDSMENAFAYDDTVDPRIKALWLSLRVDMCKVVDIHEAIVNEPELLLTNVDYVDSESIDKGDSRFEEIIGMSGEEYIQLFNDVMRKMLIVTAYINQKEGGEL